MAAYELIDHAFDVVGRHARGTHRPYHTIGNTPDMGVGRA